MFKIMFLRHDISNNNALKMEKGLAGFFQAGVNIAARAAREMDPHQAKDSALLRESKAVSEVQQNMRNFYFYISPMRRTIQTYEAIAGKITNSHIEILPSLQEVRKSWSDDLVSKEKRQEFSKEIQNPILKEQYLAFTPTMRTCFTKDDSDNKIVVIRNLKPNPRAEFRLQTVDIDLRTAQWNKTGHGIGWAVVVDKNKEVTAKTVTETDDDAKIVTDDESSSSRSEAEAKVKIMNAFDMKDDDLMMDHSLLRYTATDDGDDILFALGNMASYDHDVKGLNTTYNKTLTRKLTEGEELLPLHNAIVQYMKKTWFNVDGDFTEKSIKKMTHKKEWTWTDLDAVKEEMITKIVGVVEEHMKDDEEKNALVNRLNESKSNAVLNIQDDLRRAQKYPYKLLYAVGALFRLQYFGGFKMGADINMELVKKTMHEKIERENAGAFFVVESQEQAFEFYSTKTVVKEGEFACIYDPGVFSNVLVSEKIVLTDDENETTTTEAPFAVHFTLTNIDETTTNVLVVHLSSGSDKERTEQANTLKESIDTYDFIVGDFNSSEHNEWLQETFELVVQPQYEIKKTRFTGNMFANNQFLKGAKQETDHMYIFKKR